MAKFYQDEKFNALQKEWYAKLKEEGFHDIETIGSNGDAYPLMTSGAGCYSSSLDVLRKWSPDKQRYFELARAHYWTMADTDPEALDMFRLYAFGGFTFKRVSDLMGCNRKRVSSAIRKEEAKFLPRRAPKLRLVK